MRRAIISIIVISLFLVGCTTQPEQPSPPVANDAESAPDITDTTDPTPEPAEAVDEEDLINECLANPSHPIGKQIAADFADLTSYQQVMDWFCSGFEFEDILTALETEEISDFQADILLTMLEYGQSWDEIWVEIGLE